jgi:hypothetical protein
MWGRFSGSLGAICTTPNKFSIRSRAAVCLRSRLATPVPISSTRSTLLKARVRDSVRQPHELGMAHRDRRQIEAVGLDNAPGLLVAVAVAQ